MRDNIEFSIVSYRRLNPGWWIFPSLIAKIRTETHKIPVSCITIKESLSLILLLPLLADNDV